MKKSAKIFVVTAAVAMCLGAHSAFAASNYGKDLSGETISGRFVDGTFEDHMPSSSDTTWKLAKWPFNDTVFFDTGASGNHTAVSYISDEEARTGSMSLKIDMDGLANCSTETSKKARYIGQQKVKYDKAQTFYYEAWVKIKNTENASQLDEKGVGWESPVHIRLDDYGAESKYTNGFSVAKSTAETDENGWQKLSITKDTVTTSGSTLIGPAIMNYYPAGEGLGAVYFDDFKIYVLPASMRIAVPADIYDPDVAVALEDITIYGKDKAGEEEAFVDYSNINYTIESGDAEIVDGKLVFTGESAGDVVLKAEFLGLTTTATIKFGSGMEIMQAVKNSNGSYRFVLKNLTSTDRKATVIATVFDKNNVMQGAVKSETISVTGGNIGMVNTPVVDLTGVENPEIRIFLWDSLTGMTPYSDIIINP